MFKEKIKELMKNENITQKQLSEKSGITEASISRYLTGERVPRIDIIINFAKALNVSAEYLIYNDEELKEKEDAYIQCQTAIARNKKNLTNEEREKLIEFLKKEK